MTPLLTGVFASQISGHLYSAAGSYDALATITVPSGGLSSITFAGIPNGYRHLQIRGIAQDNRATYNTSGLNMQLNGDTAGNYSWHYLQAAWDAGSSGAQSSGAGSGSDIGYLASITSSVASNVFAGVIIDFTDYADTNKYKTVRCLSGADANADASGYRPHPRLSSGSWRNKSPISSITLYSQFGTLINQYSQFALYGVK